jgi:uncharacterized protein with gpF-like domain
MREFNRLDKLKLQQVNDGLLTDGAYQSWRKEQLLLNKQAKDMIDEMAKGMTRTNQTATAVINKQTAAVFADASNFQMYQIEKGVRAVTSFSLIDVNTVARLALVPQAKTRVAKDLMWNNKKIRSAIMQGVLQGESIEKISARLKTVVRMNQSMAVKTARTFVTAASNDGNLYSMQYAKDVGVKVKKMWVATLDDRTRSSHALLDGETVELDEKFSNDLMFAAVQDGETSRKAVTKNLIEKNVKYMSYILNKVQMHKYLMVLNTTIKNRDIDIDK